MKRFNTELYVLNQRLDLYEGDSISINAKIKDVRDPHKVFEGYSHSFVVPASKTNSRVLQHCMRVDLVSLDTRAYHDAEIRINKRPWRDGFVKIEKLMRKNGKAHSYTLRFYGQLVNLKTILGEDELSNLDFELNKSSVEHNNTNWDNLLKTPPNETVPGISTNANKNLRICLNAFDKGYYFDSSTSPVSRGDRYTNIAHTTYTTDSSRIADNGVPLDTLKPSFKDEGILEAIEEKYKLRFSRGLDSEGFPTSNIDDVVTGNEHYFGSKSFRESYMLLHNKVSDDAVDTFDKVPVSFDESWGNTLSVLRRDNTGSTITIRSARDFDGTTDTIFLFPFRRNGNNRRTYYMYVRVTNSGSGAYKITAVDHNENVVFDSGSQTGTYENVSGATRNDFSGDADQGPSTYIGEEMTVGGSPGFARIPNTEQALFYGVRFYKQADPDADLTITVEITQEDVDRTGLRRFNRDVDVFRNVSSGDNQTANFAITDNIPKLKLIDYVSGFWKQYLLAGYYDKDANGDDIIVVPTINRFYNEGETLDYTAFIDSQQYDVTSPSLYSDIKFEFSSPKTYLAKEYESAQKYKYGDLNHSIRKDEAGNLVNIKLPFKEYKVKVPFEQVVLTGVTDENDDSVDLDIVYGWMATESLQPTQPKAWRHFIEQATVGGSTNMLVRSFTNTALSYSEYNAPTKYLRESSTSPHGDVVETMTFGRELDERTATQTSTGSDNTIFKLYHEDWIVRTFNQRAKLVRVKGRMNNREVQRFNLANTIINRGKSYHINSADIDTGDGRFTMELLSLANATPAIAPAVIERDQELRIRSFTSDQPASGSLISTTVTFTVLVEGGEGGYSYTWYKNGAEITGAVDNIYAASGVEEGDAFYVEVQDDLTTVKSTEIEIVEIDNSPRITISLSGSTVPTLGTDVTFSSSASSPRELPLTYQWRKDGADISGATNATYTIADFEISDAGDFTCVVSETGGDSATSNTITLTADVLLDSDGNNITDSDNEGITART